MTDLISWLMMRGPVLAAGATLLLAAGSGCVAVAGAPVRRQRIAELTVTGTLAWFFLACAPLPRWLPESLTPPVKLVVALWFSPHVPGRDIVENTLDRAGRGERATRIRQGSADDDRVERSTEESQTSGDLQEFGLRAETWRRSGSVAFLVGAALSAFWLCVGQILLLIVRATVNPAPAWIAGVRDSLLPGGWPARWRVVVSSKFDRPVSWGILRPTVLLPTAMCRRGNEQQLRTILLHEAAHLERRDAWGKTLLGMALPCLYWNPLYWWLRQEAHMAAELLADELAAAPIGRETYVTELVALARMPRRRGVPLVGVSGALSNPSRFYRRMQMLLERKKPLTTRSSTAWRILATGSCGGIVLLAALFLGIHPATAEELPQEKTGAESASTVPYSMALEKAAVSAQISALQARLQALEAQEEKSRSRQPVRNESPRVRWPDSVRLTWTGPDGAPRVEQWSLAADAGGLQLTEMIRAGTPENAARTLRHDTPSAEEILRALPSEPEAGAPPFADVSRKNVRIVVEKIADRLDASRYYPLVGPARKQSRHFKCTVNFDQVTRSDWPVPLSRSEPKQEVIYIDHDHLIRGE